MILKDFHVHTNFCDGADAAEDVALTAIDMGMTHLGFSGHSHTAFDESYCMSAEKTAEYRREIARLKEKYADKIRIFCGIEQDCYSDAPTAGYDYVIGSVHYIEKDGDFFPIDESAAELSGAAQKYYGGDIYALAEDYFARVGGILEKTGADIVGHFDLVTKFNEGSAMFDEDNPRYRAAAAAAADRLLAAGAVFEINTGAMLRGYRKSPYPSRFLLDYITERGGKLILSSDSHSRGSLCYRFSEYEKFVTYDLF